MASRRVIVALACALLLAAPVQAVARERADRRPLERAGRWLVDEQGRVVVMHGVNFVQKEKPFYTSMIGTPDARFFADEGFNTARVGVIWEGLEPRPGRYDDRYVARLARFDRLLARHGIRTLVDLHQDFYSRKANATLGDGAPDWATLKGNALDDFQAFWDDEKAAGGVGIQTRFANALAHLAASRLGSSANVFGYDPFNEPYAGTRSGCAVFTPCPAFEAGELARFYRRVITAIRRADAKHVVFPEGVAQNGKATPALPRFADRQTAFSFHYYCMATQFSLPDSAAICTPDEERGFTTFLDYAERLGVPAFLGEFSGAAPADSIVRTVDRMGREFTSWTLWAYQDVLKDATRTASQRNADQAKLDALVVPYPQAIAGTPRRYAFDRATNTMTLSYTARAVRGARLSRRARTRIFVPQRKYPGGYRVRASNARVVSRPGARWMELVGRRSGLVTVTITPRKATDSVRRGARGALQP